MFLGRSSLAVAFQRRVVPWHCAPFCFCSRRKPCRDSFLLPKDEAPPEPCWPGAFTFGARRVRAAVLAYRYSYAPGKHCHGKDRRAQAGIPALLGGAEERGTRRVRGKEHCGAGRIRRGPAFCERAAPPADQAWRSSWKALSTSLPKARHRSSSALTKLRPIRCAPASERTQETSAMA